MNFVAFTMISIRLECHHQGPYKPCNHNLHIGVIILPNINNTQSTDLDQFEANEYEYQKLEVPINLACHLRCQLYISL